MVRMYEAAISNNLNLDFPVNISDANAEVFTSQMPTRSRARTLDRDNPYAWAMLETFRTNIGGDEPFRLEMNAGRRVGQKWVKNADKNRAVEDAWREAGLKENCTTRRDMSRLELDLQAITSMIRDGGVIARHRRAYKQNKFGYAVQPLEIDRLDHYFNGRNAKTGNDIKMSVEMDEFDGVVGYWLLSKHPGAIFWTANMRDKQREFVPAEDAIVLFDLRTRAEQVAAVSRLASIIQRLHRIDQFDLAHVTAAIWASCKPFFIIQEFPSAAEYVPDFIKAQLSRTMDEQGIGNEGEGDKVAQSEPGTGEILPWGQKPMLVDPKFPIEAAAGFKKDNLRAACAGAGVPYFIVGQDLEAVNFSSGRIGLEAFHDSCKVLQRHFIDNYRRPHFNEWLKSALSLNQIAGCSLADYEELRQAAIFHGRRWPYIQPLQDAQADALQLQMRLTSRDRIIAESERGGDYEQVASELASDIETDESHGLPEFDATAKPGQQSGGEQKQGESGEPQSGEMDLAGPTDETDAKV